MCDYDDELQGGVNDTFWCMLCKKMVTSVIGAVFNKKLKNGALHFRGECQCGTKLSKFAGDSHANKMKSRASKKRATKRRVSEKRVSKSRASKKRATKRRVSKKRVSESRASKKRVTRSRSRSQKRRASQKH